MRWQWAVAPEVRAGGGDTGTAAIIHPLTDAEVVVPSAFLALVPYAARPFTARELLERSGAPVAPAVVEQALAELRAVGLIVPASGIVERVGRGANPLLRALAFPAVGLPLLTAAAVGVALQLQSALFFSKQALTSLRGALVVPMIIAVVAVPAARALFRAQLLQTSARRAALRMRGVIPTWELEHPLPLSRAGQWLAHLSGFLFDFLVINACVLSMHAKPFELGYAGIETPVAFLVVTAALSVIAANPLAKYDAYYALEHALGVADLRGHARARLFQLASRRRFDVATVLYAAYFAATILYSLAASVGLLALSYALAAGLFPVDRTVRLSLATALVGLVLWRAIRAVYRPVVRALAVRRREARSKGATPDDDEPSAVLAWPPQPASTLAPSLSATEGFPFALQLVEGTNGHVHDFAALAPNVDVLVFKRADVDAYVRDLDLDDPALRALALRMFGLAPRALGDDARRAACLAFAANERREGARAARFPLERYEPVAEVAVVDGTFKHAALDTAARLRSASELDVYRALFAPLRSRHAGERDRVAVAFRDKASDRFSCLALVDDNASPADVARRLDGLRRSLERGTAAPARVDPGGAAAVLAAVPRTSLALAARLRRTTPELLERAGVRAILSPADLDPSSLSPQASAWAQAAALVFPETRAGKTRLAVQVRCPTLLLPTGPASAPTGLKLRVLVDEPFAPAERWFAPRARYEIVTPLRNFLGAGAAALDARLLPVWIGEGGAGDCLFAFDGELKAMACRHLLDLPALSTSGFNHPFQAALARHMAADAGALSAVAFVLDEESPVYRRGRTDQLQDPLVRTLQLAWRTHALAPQKKLTLMRGLSHEGKKLDLDEVAGLGAGLRDEMLRRFRGNTADAVDLGALFSKIGPWLAELCAFSDKMYAALDDVKRARVRGSSQEARAAAQAIVELVDLRKQLNALAGDARDTVMKALHRVRGGAA